MEKHAFTWTTGEHLNKPFEEDFLSNSASQSLNKFLSQRQCITPGRRLCLTRLCLGSVTAVPGTDSYYDECFQETTHCIKIFLFFIRAFSRTSQSTLIFLFRAHRHRIYYMCFPGFHSTTIIFGAWYLVCAFNNCSKTHCLGTFPH